MGQIVPFNFSLLMAACKIAPALAAGNYTVLKPASPTQSLIPSTTELGGKSPNIFFDDVMAAVSRRD